MSEGREQILEMIDLLIEEVGRLQVIPLEATYILDNQDLQGELANLKTIIEGAEREK